MDFSLLTTGVMTLLSPILDKEKESDQSDKTIGQKLEEEPRLSRYWQQIQGLFQSKEARKMLKDMEGKTTISLQEFLQLEQAILDGGKDNPDFVANLQATFNLSITDALVVQQLLISLQEDHKQLAELFEQRRNAGIATAGQYDNMIALTRKRMKKDEQEFLKLVS